MTDEPEVRLAWTDNPDLRHITKTGWLSRRELRARQEQALAEAARDTATPAVATATHLAWIDKQLLRGIPITGANVGGAQRYTRPGDCTRCARMGRTCPACAQERRRPNP